MNCKGPYRETSSQHWSMLRYCLCAIRSHPRTRNKFVGIVAAVECYLIITHVKKINNQEAAVPNVPFYNNIPLADERISVKKGTSL